MKLENIVKESDRLLVGDQIPDKYRSNYRKDAVELTAVVYPKTTQEVVNVMKYSKAEQVPVITMGANTTLADATRPSGGEIFLDMSQMNNILEFDEENFIINVEPGVTIAETQKFAEEKGYYYPPDPGSKNSTIGGNVSTNAGGMRAVKYGVTRDYVRKLEVVTADGEVLELGAKAIKNSSGYNLKELFVGSEGTLGVITKIWLAVIPYPKINQTLIAAMPSLDEAADTVEDIMRSGIDLTSLELFDRKGMEYSEEAYGEKYPSSKGTTFLQMIVDGDQEASIEQRINALKAITDRHGAEEFLILNEEQTETAWLLRDKILGAIGRVSGENECMDISLPLSEFAPFIKHTNEVEEKFGVEIINFGHAGDGNIHTDIIAGDLEGEEWEEKLDEVSAYLYRYIDKVGGLPSAEHAIGLVKKPYFEDVMSDEFLKYQSRVKLAFDPENRLNPGKIFDITE